MAFIALYECEAKGGSSYSRSSSSSSYSRSSSSSSHSRSSPSYSRSSSSSSHSRSSSSSSRFSSSHSRYSPSHSRSSSSSSRSSSSHSRYSPSHSRSSSSSSRSSSSHSHSSPSSSSSSHSHSSPSHSSPSHSYTHSAPSYGWNVHSPSGSHTSGSSHYGAPPAYPGLHNQAVPSHNRPPAYSPSYRNPPAYSSGNSHHSHYSPYPGSYSNTHKYGQTFGSSGLPGNTYISNNYYGNQRSGSNNGFLTNALFYSAGTHHGHSWGHRSSYSHSNSHRRTWSDDDDQKWRGTTKAPYFENKVPGEDKILPASAVVGAATAFGLASLLPLRVPPSKPLMYCNNTELDQSLIRIDNGNVYYCLNNTIQILYPQEKLKNVNATNENSTVSEKYETLTHNSFETCESRTMTCDTDEIIYCNNGTLLSKNSIFCNSTTLMNATNVNDTKTILNCYEGELPLSKASFVPTTTTKAPKTTEKSLSFEARAHVFFLHVIGKSDILNRTTTTLPPIDWIPKALTIPPEPTTTTTEAPFDWMMERKIQFENGTFGTELQPIWSKLVDEYMAVNQVDGVKIMPLSWKKVYRTESTTQSSFGENIDEI